MRVVAFATIKMNSQRVPYKNIRILGTRPLCYHTLNTALQITGIDEVIAYCSDEEIQRYIPSAVRFVKREKWLDADSVQAQDVYTAFINDVDADIYVSLLTTAPFIKVNTMAHALNEVVSGEYDSAFCVKRMQTFAWNKGEPLNYDPQAIPRTQDLEPVFLETSGFFIFTKELWLREGRRIGHKPLVQELDDIESIDIDTPTDFEFAKLVASHMLHWEDGRHDDDK